MSDTAMNYCEDCDLSYSYNPRFHKCQPKTKGLAGPWVDEVKEKLGIDKWKEERGER